MDQFLASENFETPKKSSTITKERFFFSILKTPNNQRIKNFLEPVSGEVQKEAKLEHHKQSLGGFFSISGVPRDPIELKMLDWNEKKRLKI